MVVADFGLARIIQNGNDPDKPSPSERKLILLLLVRSGVVGEVVLNIGWLF